MSERLLSSREVAQLLGVCIKTVLNRYQSAKGFPRPVRPLGARGLKWRASEVQRYVETLNGSR